MNSRRTAVITCLAIALFACGRDSTAPVPFNEPTPPNGPIPPTPVANVKLSRVLSTLIVGMGGQTVSATLKSASGAVITDRPVTWKSSNPAAATVAANPVCGPAALVCHRTQVYAIGDGSTTISASVEGLSASADIVVVADPPVTQALAVESFSLIEVQSASADSWYYAPQVRVRETTGVRGAEVIGVRFTIPGIGATAICSSLRHFAAGQSADLFREIYGDFELTFDRPGARATPGAASAVVYVRDGGGNVGKVTASGPVVPDGFPSSYTGGTIADPWSC